MPIGFHFIWQSGCCVHCSDRNELESDRNLLLFVWPQTECLAGWVWWDAMLWYYIVISSLPYNNSLCKHNLIMKKWSRIQNTCTFLDFIMQYITRYYILYTTIMAFFSHTHHECFMRPFAPIRPLPISLRPLVCTRHKWTLGKRFCRIRNSTQRAAFTHGAARHTYGGPLWHTLWFCVWLVWFLRGMAQRNFSLLSSPFFAFLNKKSFFFYFHGCYGSYDVFISNIMVSYQSNHPSFVWLRCCFTLLFCCSHFPFRSVPDFFSFASFF